MKTSPELRCRARGLALLLLGSQLLQGVVAAPCPPVLHAWDVDVRSVHIQGRFRLAGGPFPASFLQGANFFLRNPETGDEVYLGLNIPARSLGGAFRLNGAAFPPAQNAAISLRSAASEDALVLGGTAEGAYATVIIPGRYHAVYNWAVGNLIPRNQAAEVDCARVLKVLPIGLGVGNLFEPGDE